MNGPEIVGDYLHKEYPKQFAKTEFWKQIKRTVNGEPVSDQDIDLIVKQIISQLDLQPNDHLLDLGCGNGALASRLFSQCKQYTGVDFSEYLLSVAEEYFCPRDGIRYIQSDIRQTQNFVSAATSANKVLIYGCIGYLHRHEVKMLLHDLKTALCGLSTILIGNVADESRAGEFFRARSVNDYLLDDPSSPIGVWWEQAEWKKIGDELGFQTTCVSMRDDFYGSRYRYDVVFENNHAPKSVG
ncbi:MAG: methyltransferase domain-containing protein [Pirellulaceae bacterium]|nr:methyltransferase domain-containing protein [Pirellulaceae bacterium]